VFDRSHEPVTRGAPVSEPFRFEAGGQRPGPDSERRDANTFLKFEDPDGNGWLVQGARRGTTPTS